MIESDFYELDCRYADEIKSYGAAYDGMQGKIVYRAWGERTDMLCMPFFAVRLWPMAGNGVAGEIKTVTL